MCASILCIICWRRPTTHSTLISCEHVTVPYLPSKPSFLHFLSKILQNLLRNFSDWLTTFIVTKEGRCHRSLKLRRISAGLSTGKENWIYIFFFNHDHLLTLPLHYFNFCFLSPLCLLDVVLIWLYTRGIMPNVCLQNERMRHIEHYVVQKSINEGNNTHWPLELHKKRPISLSKIMFCHHVYSCLRWNSH